MSTAAEQIALIEQSYLGHIAEANQIFADFCSLDSARLSLTKGSPEFIENRRQLDAVALRQQNLCSKLSETVALFERVHNENFAWAGSDGHVDGIARAICETVGQIERLGQLSAYMNHLKLARS